MSMRPLTQINALRPPHRQADGSFLSPSGVDVRRWRRWLAALMILGFASAQFISLAHACMNSFGVAHGAAGHVVDHHVAGQATGAMPADCPAMILAGGAGEALCEAQCVPREQADKAADLRVALAPPSVLVVRVIDPIAPNVVHAAPPRATIASPPLSLLFGRFLN
jgi:hypothetical protein